MSATTSPDRAVLDMLNEQIELVLESKCPECSEPVVHEFRDEQIELILEGKCPECSEPVVHEFRDEFSRKEFEISGLCQQCQDKMFDIPF